MTQAVTYERETKSVAFQGKIIVLESLTPVSYTHLDVYKRQVPHPGWDNDDPCKGCRYYKECKGKKKQLSLIHI